MSPYFESIRIQGRQIHLLPYHTARLNRTRQHLLGCSDAIDLDIVLPDNIDDGIWKCRVVYGTQVESITFESYTRRSIRSYQIIDGGSDIDYTYKGDRTHLLQLYDQRGLRDDIIIVRDGYLTDSFWSNILLSQDDRWYTPATPLLRGVMRQHLLDNGVITERIIRLADLKTYDRIMTVNALNPFDEDRAEPVAHVYP